MSLLDFFRPGSDGRARPVSPRIEPMAVDSPSSASPGMAKLVAVAGAAAIGMVAIVGGFEGKRNDPYLDIVKVPTVCYGETNVPMRRYSDAECADMLAGSLADYAQAVLDRNPELRGHDAQLLAASSLAYNIGPAAYRRSTVAKRFSAGDWRGACDAFMRWNTAGGRPVAGLTARRTKERAICLRGLS